MFTVSIIGVGKLAHKLVPFLHAKGVTIHQILGRDLNTAYELAGKVNASAIDKLSELNSSSEFYLLCVNDDAIVELTQELIDYLPSDKNIIHFSGMQGVDAIDSYFKGRGVLWPLQSLNEGVEIHWEEIPFFVESNQEIQNLLFEFCSFLRLRTHVVQSNDKKWIHIAAVFANNFSNFNLVVASEILKSINIPFDVMETILTTTMQQAFQLGPEQTQTGPAVRHDTEVIKKQLLLLNEKFRQYEEIYRIMSQQIIHHFGKK